MNPVAKYRIQSLDLLRGLVMIIMALDHARDFFHYGANIGENPTGLKTTTTILFFTRWITHFCAPVFMLLAGIGMYLFSEKQHSKKQMFIFLFTRGLWLIFVEVFIIGPIWNFNFSGIVLQVIWAFGISMIFLSFLQFLPYMLLAPLGLIIVFGHNLLDKINIDHPIWQSMIWSMTHVAFNRFPLTDTLGLAVFYPFLPWLGLMISGYALGKIYSPNISPSFRKKFLLWTGFSMILLFILIRAINGYGDRQHWVSQKSGWFTILDFIRTSKYPPSLLYILMTVGPALVFLSVTESVSISPYNKILVFGKVPLFYYILHIFLIHIVAWGLFFASGHSWAELDFSTIHPRLGSIPKGFGYPLGIVYLLWASIVFILYFPCKWYANYKSTHNQWWLSYM
ncbi:MAG: DUF1624 domain-containing protein [Chitinophagales bacterium]